MPYCNAGQVTNLKASHNVNASPNWTLQKIQHYFNIQRVAGIFLPYQLLAIDIFLHRFARFIHLRLVYADVNACDICPSVTKCRTYDVTRHTDLSC